MIESYIDKMMQLVKDSHDAALSTQKVCTSDSLGKLLQTKERMCGVLDCMGVIFYTERTDRKPYNMAIEYIAAVSEAIEAEKFLLAMNVKP